MQQTKNLITVFVVECCYSILESNEHGNPRGADKPSQLVFEELRKLAASRLGNEAPNQTLQPTALVQEAWLRLVGIDKPQFANRAHFFSAAVEAMRRILIDKTRRKRARRHGGDQHRADLEGVEVAESSNDDDLLAVNDALDKLANQINAKAGLVKLRYFVAMTLEDVSAAMGISARTADKYWARARTWLFGEIDAGRKNGRHLVLGMAGWPTVPLLRKLADQIERGRSGA